MIIDARTLPDGEIVDADLCIIGGGAAGITMALEMASPNLKVVLLESGDMYFEEKTQSLYEGPLLGFKGQPLDEVRLRFLGGSTNHWAGVCLEFAEHDFEERAGIPNSGWPIDKSDLSDYYQRAKRYVEIPDDFDDAAKHAASLDLPIMPFDEEKLINLTWGASPPTAFGYAYEENLKQAPNLTVLLNANAQNLKANAFANSIDNLDVACIDGPRFFP